LNGDGDRTKGWIGVRINVFPVQLSVTYHAHVLSLIADLVSIGDK